MANSGKSRRTEDGFKAPRVRKRMDLDDAHLELTQTIRLQGAIERDPKTTIAEKNAAGHLKNQCIGNLNRLLQAVDVDERLKAVEKDIADAKAAKPKELRKVS